MSAPPRFAQDRPNQILLALIAIAIAYLWILPMKNGFWLDECLGVWAGQGDFRDIVPRSLVGGQMIAFSTLEWLLQRVGVTTEFGFRLPSLAAGVATLFVLYRLGTEILGRQFGLTLAALFSSMPLVAPAIPNNRPYALALLAQTGGLLWLFRWLRSRSIRHGLLWIVSSVVAGFFHFLFLLPLVLEALFVCFVFARRYRDRFNQVVLSGVVCVTLLLLIAPQLRVTLAQTPAFFSTSRPPWGFLLQALLPLPIVLGAALSIGLEWLSGSRVRWRAPRSGGGDRDALVLGAWMLILPALLFFGVARYLSISLFITRYFLPTVAGGLLVWGWLLSGLLPHNLRSASVAATVALGIIGAALSAASSGLIVDYVGENWRSAVNAMAVSGQYLVYPGLVETGQLDWLQSPERKQYFMAPVTIFRPNLSFDTSYILPYEADAGERAYLQPILAQITSAGSEVTIIARAYPNGPKWVAWLSQQLTAAGFHSLRSSTHGQIIVAVWAPPS